MRDFLLISCHMDFILPKDRGEWISNTVFTELAFWAKMVYYPQCLSMCLCVCLSVCVIAKLLLPEVEKKTLVKSSSTAFWQWWHIFKKYSVLMLVCLIFSFCSKIALNRCKKTTPASWFFLCVKVLYMHSFLLNLAL